MYLITSNRCTRHVSTIMLMPFSIVSSLLAPEQISIICSSN